MLTKKSKIKEKAANNGLFYGNYVSKSAKVVGPPPRKDIVLKKEVGHEKEVEFTEEVRDVLLRPMPDRPLRENREPTREELKRRYKLKRHST